MNFSYLLSILICFCAFSLPASASVQSTAKGNEMISTIDVPMELTGTLGIEKVPEGEYNICPPGQDFILKSFDNGRAVTYMLYFENDQMREKLKELIGKVVRVQVLSIVKAEFMEDSSIFHCYMEKVISIVEVN